VNSDLRVKSSLGVGVVGVVLLTPFSVNHLLQGRILLGTGTMLIVVVMGAMAWTGWRGRYNPWLVLVGFVPAVLVFLSEAFREQGVIGALWCFPAILAFYFTLPERQAWLSNRPRTRSRCRWRGASWKHPWRRASPRRCSA